MTKLPVLATLTEAYRAIWANRGALPRFAVVPFVLILAIDLATAEFGQEYGASVLTAQPEESSRGTVEQLGPLLRAVAVNQLGPILGAVVLIAFVVPCYRLLLLGPTAMRAPRGSWPVRRVYLGMLGLTVVIAVLVDGPLAVFDYLHADHDTQAWLLLVILHLAVLLCLAVRLAFLYPAICLGHAWDPATRWRETAGNFWRLSAAFLLALAPLLAALVLWAATFFLWWDEASDVVPGTAPLETFLVTLVLFTGEVLWAAVTVVAFATLTGYPVKGVRVPGAGS